MNYPYDITSVAVLTNTGEVLSSPPENEDFITEVSVEKKEDSAEKDYIFVAVYNTNGILLNIDCAEANFDTNSDYASFDFSIPAQRAEIGSIRAFIWSGVNSMNPLAEIKTISFTN